MTDTEFGSVLYKLYHTLVKIEADELKDNKNCTDLTVNELNLIECIRNLTKGGEGPTISMIAAALDITRPSTTVAVNKLTSKKIVTKSECSSDGRSVRVKLTPKGEKAYSAHHSFQMTLVKAAKNEMSESEWQNISDSLSKIAGFLNTKAEESNGRN